MGMIIKSNSIGTPLFTSDSSDVQTVNGISPTNGNVQLSAQTGNYSDSTKAETYVPGGQYLIETCYAKLNNFGLTINLGTISSLTTTGSLQPGYTLRIFVYASTAQSIIFKGSTTLRFNGIASSGTVTINLNPSEAYIFELVAVSAGSFAISQLQPTELPTSSVNVTK